MFTITRTHLFTKWTKLDSEADQDTARWIATTLDFLIEFNETLTGPELAARLEGYSYPVNPKTAFAIDFLRSHN